MPDRPYVLVKCAMSLDGYLDDSSPERLILSSPEDFARVDEVRSEVDAILVGATTVRKDNPRLMVRSDDLRRARVQRDLNETPTKVIISGSGDLDPSMPIFTTGDCEKIVYTSARGLDTAKDRLGAVATIAACGDPLDLRLLLHDLKARGVARLLVEGGKQIHTQFLAADVVDEIQVSIAPFFVGDSTAPRFVGDARFPFDKDHRMLLVGISQHGDCVLLLYVLPRIGSR